MVERVSIIVPAHNEGLYIGAMLDSLKMAVAENNKSGGIFSKKPNFLIQNIVVVDDGSSDKTAQIARWKEVGVVSLPKNLGKSFAFFKGVEHAKQGGATIVLMLDADLEPVSLRQIKMLVNPVVQRKCKMAVGTVHEDSIPASGQRAIRLSALEPLFNGNKKWEMYLGIKGGKQKRRMGYSLEYALNNLLPKTIVNTHFRTQRWYGFKSLVSGTRIDYADMQMREMQREQKIRTARQKIANQLRFERKSGTSNQELRKKFKLKPRKG